LTKPQRSSRTLDAIASREECVGPEAAHARLERIARLRKAIADGTYQISAADIAEKMISRMHSNRYRIH